MNEFAAQLGSLAAGIHIKQAEGAYGDAQISTQQYFPVQGKRDLSSEEQGQVEGSKSNLIPKLFVSRKTPIHEMMASPGKQALLAALLGGGLGAAGGGVMGAGMGGAPGGVLGAGIGGLGLGGLAALMQYYSRKQQNENLEDAMTRLPEGATYRDFMSDPTEQASANRANDLMAARLMAARRFMQ